MTSNPQVDTQRQLARIIGLDSLRPSELVSHTVSSRLSSSAIQQGSASTQQRDSGHLHKRRRLDLGFTSFSSLPYLQRNHEDPASRRSPYSAAVNPQPTPSSLRSPPTRANKIDVPGFPIKPRGLKSRTGGSSLHETPSTPCGTVQVNAYRLEASKLAPEYGNGSAADFFPWLGHHPEDILNEQSTKSGYFDKSQISQNEATTARPMVWNPLKHKSGLHILSSLYISIIDKRLVHASTPPKCTFKPPPRVTLPDTKREAWLRDLAKPTTALRRLSRTIPHGIRGKALLDHCLAKRIPIRRAVWLAKCVGANEIRAFKRKGSAGAFSAGGESKWIKDWTSNVEHFLEALMMPFHPLDWIVHLAYGLQLVMHILSEDLLDQDHFFEWILASLDKTDSDTLPVWMLVIQAYANSMKRSYFRNQQLLGAMVYQLQKVTRTDSKVILTTLESNIHGVMSSLIANHPLDTRDRERTSYFQYLQMRNFHRPRSSKADIAASYQTPRQKLISLLDNQTPHVDVRALSVLTRDLVHDFNVLVSTLIEWSATLHRVGLSRIYIALRLLRHWKSEGIDLHPSIFSVMSDIRRLTILHPSNMYKLFGELVRSGLVSVGRYLQWLLARGRGGYSNESDAEIFELRLLHHIPLHGLQNHVLNLRKMILTTGGQSTLSTEEDSAQHAIASRIEYLQDKTTSPMIINQECDINSLSGTGRFALSRWLRQTVADAVHYGDRGAIGMADITAKSGQLSINDFRFIRTTIESLEDHLILADILGIISLSGHDSLLEFVADALNFHIDIFQSIGVAESLFHRLLARLETSPSKGPESNPLLTGLIDLAERMPPLNHLLVKLRHKAQTREVKEMVIGPSPVSDQCIQAHYFSDTTSIDDMESLCSSETIMDPQIIARVFSIVSRKLQAELNMNPQKLQRYMDLLAQLRVFNHERFDLIMTDWLWTLIQSTDRSSLHKLLIFLVCVQVLDLGKLLESARVRLEGTESQELRTRLFFEFLSILCSDLSGMIDQIPHFYRFNRAREQILLKQPAIVVYMIQCSLDLYLDAEPPLRQSVKTLLLSSAFLQALRTLLLHNESTIGELGGSLGNSKLVDLALQVMHRLLGLEHPTDSSAPRIDIEIRRLLDAAGDFNIQICKLKLLILIAQCRSSSSELGTYEKLSVKLIRDAILAFPSRLGLWTRLISVLPQDYAELLRSGSLHELLAMMPDGPSKPQPVPSPVKADSQVCKCLLACIDVAESRVSSAGSITVIMEIIRKTMSIRNMPQVLTLPQEHSFMQCIDTKKRLAEQEEISNVGDWIRILLFLLEVHYDRIMQHKLPQQHLCHLVLSLSLLLICPFTTNYATVSTHIFDIIALYSESLSLESRSYCAAVLRDQYNVRDVRFQHIFGAIDCEQGDSLCVSSGGKSVLLFPFDPSSGVPHALRRWELLQDATPTIGENDTSLSLHLFQTRKVSL